MPVFNKIPKRVTINEIPYDIRLVKNPDNDKKLHGIIFYNDHIQVCSEQDRPSLESTLIHEILHGVSRHYALRLCEVSIEKLEKGIYELFEKNGWKIQVK